MRVNFPFTIRTLDSNDIDHAITLSDSEGWNQTEKDWRLLIENPHNKCFAAVYDGYIVGTATALNHSGKVAWIGMVIVRKSFRGQGIGKALLTRIIGELKNFDSIKLDATTAGIPLYHKLGFIDEYNICRMVTPSLSEYKIEPFKEKPVPIDQESFTKVLKSDREIFGADRSYLLHSLYSTYPGKAYCLRRVNKIAGFMFGRDGKRYNYIGPVSADSNETARILISKALESMNHQPVVLDVLNDREDTVRWLESRGFIKQRFFVRMYLKSNAYCGIVKNQYLISGPEFG